MKKLALFLSLICASFTVLVAQEKDLFPEPTSQLIISVDGKSYPITEREEIDINGQTVSVERSAFKTFDYNKLKFNYPNHFAYAYEEDFGFRSWTLDGNDYVITYFEFMIPLSIDDFTKEIAKKFGKGNCKISSIKKTLGEYDLKGKRINVNLIGESLNYDLLEIPSDDSKTHIIGLQDLIEEGITSQEGKETLEMISKSLEIKE